MSPNGNERDGKVGGSVEDPAQLAYEVADTFVPDDRSLQPDSGEPAETTIIVKSGDIQRGALPIYDEDYLDRLYNFDFEKAGLLAKVVEAIQTDGANLLAAVGRAMKECLVEARLLMPILGTFRPNDDVSAFIRKKIDLAEVRLSQDGGNVNEVNHVTFVSEYILKADGFEKEYLASILERSFLVNRHQDNQFQMMRRLAAERADFKGKIEVLTGQVEAAKESGRIDELTQLPNRKGLAHYLKQVETAFEKDDPTKFAVILFDGDHFKRVNDRWGHPAGDHVLKEMARIAKAQGWDFTARIGGEEYLLICQLQGGEDLQELGDKLRRDIAVEEMRFQSSSGLPITYHQTVSVGVAAGSVEELLNWDLITQSDVAAYNSKAEGRDRVTVYEHGVAYKMPPNDR